VVIETESNLPGGKPVEKGDESVLEDGHSKRRRRRTVLQFGEVKSGNHLQDYGFAVGGGVCEKGKSIASESLKKSM